MVCEKGPAGFMRLVPPLHPLLEEQGRRTFVTAERDLFPRAVHLALAAWLILVTAGCTSPDARSSIEFDAGRAMRHVGEIVSYGPRPVESEALARTRGYIIEQLRAAGLEAREQAFTARTPLGPKRMVNVQGILPGRRDAAIALGAHYESKLYLNKRFVGANDSASAVGVLLELARALASGPPEFTLWFLFFDGEEALLTWNADDSLYGSRRFVAELKRSNALATLAAMINLDMIGDAKLDVAREQRSTKWLRDLVWQAAAELGYADAFAGPNIAIDDDHAPFLRAGIPALDLIDYTYGGNASPGSYWHTPGDRLDKLSRQSLKIIGDTVLHSLPKIAARLGGASSAPRR